MHCGITSPSIAAMPNAKGRFCLDAFAVQTAIEFQATLVTGDPELKALNGITELRFEWLPRRSAAT